MYVGWLVVWFVCLLFTAHCSIFVFRCVWLTILYAGVMWCAFDWHFTSMFIKFHFVNVCLTLLYHFGIRIYRSGVCLRVCTVYKYSALSGIDEWSYLFVFVSSLFASCPETFPSLFIRCRSRTFRFGVYFIYFLFLSPSLSFLSFLFIYFFPSVLLFCHSSWFWLASTRIHAHTHTHKGTVEEVRKKK